MTENNVKKI